MEINELFWLICGILGILLELIVPGLVLVFFGIGALVTAAIAYFFDISLAWQVLTFVVVSCVTLAFFRKYFKQILFNRNKKKTKERDELADDFQGKTAVVIENFQSLQGKVEFNGTSWKAVATENFQKDEIVFIEKRDNITLIVTKNKGE